MINTSASFLNHSIDPKIKMALSTDGNNKVFVAVRDIAAGEELFGDYADYTMAVYYLKEFCVNNKTTSQMANPGLEATTI